MGEFTTKVLGTYAHLTLDCGLAKVAQAFADDMRDKKYFATKFKSGKSIGVRAKEEGTSYNYLMVSAGTDSVSYLVGAWQSRLRRTSSSLQFFVTINVFFRPKHPCCNRRFRIGLRSLPSVLQEGRIQSCDLSGRNLAEDQHFRSKPGLKLSWLNTKKKKF